MPARHTHRLSLRSLPPNGWKNSSIVSCSLSSRWYILFTPIFKVFSPKPLFLASFMIPHFWIFFSCFFPAFLCLILIFHFFSCWKVFQQALIKECGIRSNNNILILDNAFYVFHTALHRWFRYSQHSTPPSLLVGLSLCLSFGGAVRQNRPDDRRRTSPSQNQKLYQ